jgi:hypothetical protein
MSQHAELTHLFRALKAPAAARAFPALADRAREEAWSYEKFGSLGIDVGDWAQGCSSCGGVRVIGPQVSITSARAALALWNP